MTSRRPSFADDLVAQFRLSGATMVDIPLLLPADPFLDTAGEDLRRRVFLTEGETGESLCLRPEFTIPVCCDHIARAAATPQRYAYLGEVFRQHREGGSEFFQAGMEDLGDPDEATADARSLVDAYAAVAVVAPSVRFEITLGDQAVFEAVLAALGLPAGWQKKLVRVFGKPIELIATLSGLTEARPQAAVRDGLSALVEAGDLAGLSASIEEEMEAAGLSPQAGRTPAEIAGRLIEKAELASARLGPDALETLQAFLSMNFPLARAGRVLRDFARMAHLDIDDALATFTARAEAILDAGLGDEKISYNAAFGRPLDYYTGLVYEIRASRSAGLGPLVGGGRYDRLLSLLGADGPIPGVGFSIWLDRLEALAEGMS